MRPRRGWPDSGLRRYKQLQVNAANFTIFTTRLDRLDMNHDGPENDTKISYISALIMDRFEVSLWPRTQLQVIGQLKTEDHRKVRSLSRYTEDVIISLEQISKNYRLYSESYGRSAKCIVKPVYLSGKLVLACT